MGGHQSSAMMTPTWLTPPDIIASLGLFDLDPCAAPDPRPWTTAAHHLTEEDDGLSHEWHGRIWLNPPYSAGIVKWMSRMAHHNHGTALVFARTETAWFTQYVWPSASAILFITGRLFFYRQDGTQATGNAGAPSALVAYGQEDAVKLEQSRIRGALTRSWTTR